MIPDEVVLGEVPSLPWGMPTRIDELTKDLKEESIMETINPGSLMKMTDGEKELWIDSIRAELK
eukprot:6238747-Prorocentrum_lima.AAC.1